MGKFLATTLMLGVFFVFLATWVSAKNEAPVPTPVPTPTPLAINSYELFWPLVAGRTEGDSLYSLKLLNEQVRGWLIFDKSKKADYSILLGTKRVLEAEELIKDDNIDLALKSLERAGSQFSAAYNHIKDAGSKGKIDKGVIRRDRLINVKLLIDYLKTVSSQEVQPGLDTVKDKADAMLRDHLP